MTSNTYLIKALDAFPYDLESCYEALNYALSVDETNPMGLCLMGRIYHEHFKDFNTAIDYYEAALAADLGFLETYYSYIAVLLELKSFEKAKRLIDFSKKQTSIDLFKLGCLQVELFERTREYKQALKAVDKLFLEALSADELEICDGLKSRITRKITHEKALKKKQKEQL